MLEFLRCGGKPTATALPQGTAPAEFRPGRPYWKNRELPASSRDRILSRSRAVGRPSDLSLSQFAQLLASAVDFAPDAIIELGRGLGNSTCAFTEAANLLGGGCPVLSLCTTPDWENVTKPKVTEIVSKNRFAPRDAVQADILTYRFDRALSGAKRVTLFWDAYGFEVAECVLETIMPPLSSRDHLVFMHDTSDTQRNRVMLDCADHSIHEEFDGRPETLDEVARLLGPELFSTIGHFWFTVNEHQGPYTFSTVAKS
jgi:hypothetical protein